MMMSLHFVMAFAMVFMTVSAEKLMDLKCLFITSENISPDTQVFDGWNFQYDVLRVPSTGLIGDIQLYHACVDGDDFHAKYSCIVKQPTVFPQPNGTWKDMLTAGQYAELYEYQRQTGAHMVELEVWPWRHGAATTAVWSPEKTASLVYDIPGMAKNNPVDMSLDFFNAGVANPQYFGNAAVKSVEPVWKLGNGNAFVSAIVTFNDGRQVYESYHSAGAHWRWEATALSHAWSLWVTQATFTGSRRILLSAQIDDYLLDTQVVRGGSERVEGRTSVSDMQAHVDWVRAMHGDDNEFMIELVYNGNGPSLELKRNFIVRDEEQSVYSKAAHLPKNWRKPLTEGYANDTWPEAYELETVQAQFEADPLLKWSHENYRDFYWVSHTFSHLILNNVTYYDAWCEIYFNEQFMDDVFGDVPDMERYFSRHGIVSGGISGLFNGDNLRAWTDLGIVNAVGDNSHANVLRPNGKYRGFWTSEWYNGHSGVYICPRHATNIFFNADTVWAEEHVWNQLYLGVYFDRWYNIDDIMNYESDQVAMNTMEGRRDAYMFHQGNMVIEKGQSLLMRWVDAAIAKIRVVFTLPIHTLKHDDLAEDSKFRDTEHACAPLVTMAIGEDGRVTNLAGAGKQGASCDFEVTGFSSISGAKSSRAYGPDSVHVLSTGSAASVSGGPVFNGNNAHACPIREIVALDEVSMRRRSDVLPENEAVSGDDVPKQQEREDNSGCVTTVNANEVEVDEDVVLENEDGEIVAAAKDDDDICVPTPPRVPASLVDDPLVPQEDRDRRKYFQQLPKDQPAVEPEECNASFCDSELEEEIQEIAEEEHIEVDPDDPTAGVPTESTPVQHDVSDTALKLDVEEGLQRRSAEARRSSTPGMGF
eukprot:Clim_evm8s245 gene=Clim_evmTU8s245